MKKITQILLVMLFTITSTMYGQTLTGTVMDESNQPLPGADVILVGTEKGVSTDFDGNFSLDVPAGTGTIAISFIGYNKKNIPFTITNGETKNLGKIQLKNSSESLDEIVIVGVVDVAKERQTPVAVSTIKAAEIQEKLGSQEFPEILNSTPSVYATKSGGGYGDARINIRGFSQENIAVLINGVPVNDMENSRVYWSNWAGISDVTTAMQVQRGLGASKIAISSVGGTINILTKTTDKNEGGRVAATFGNDNYLKTLFSYSTGKNDNGFATSILLSRTAGDGYVDGTKFEGYNYFIGFGLDKEKHDFQFMITGAPQTHNQRTTSFFNMAELGDYLQYGKRYNYNHGFYKGKEFNWRKNFYHKPVVSLSWNWDMSENSKLSTSAYVSFGRGGGTGDIGRLPGFKYASSSIFRDTNTGLVMWDAIDRYNQGQAVVFSDGNTYQRPNDGGINDRKDNGLTRRASMNSHNWVGVLSNFDTKLSENLTLDFGVDLRSYTGNHYRRLDNLLGANGYEVQTDLNNPNTVYTTEYSSDLSSLWNVFKDINKEEKIAYHNDGKVRWLGAFTQLEYKNETVSAFVQGSVSQQGFKRIDYFNYLASDPARETDWQNILGGNIKGGMNFNINDHNNIFANAGYYSKQPRFDAVFLNFKNDLNPDPRNEKIVGLEVGYGYKNDKVKVNINAYRTTWKDRFLRVGYRNGNIRGSADMQGIEELHKGLELDINYKITDKVKLFAMTSLGDWTYTKNVSGTAFDNNQTAIGQVDLFLDGIKVGDAAQITGRLGAEFKLSDSFKIDYNQRYVDNLYARVNAEDFGSANNNGSLKLPSYSLSDIGMTYKYKFNDESNQAIKIRLNVNNVFNHEYIAESATNYFPGDRGNNNTYLGVNTSNKAFFGFGRTWNVGVSYKF